jgi:hypothetical protein
VAQLVARLVRNEKVRGSNPLSSTDRSTRKAQVADLGLLVSTVVDYLEPGHYYGTDINHDVR